jgi:hypothetical protein
MTPGRKFCLQNSLFNQKLPTLQFLFLLYRIFVIFYSPNLNSSEKIKVRKSNPYFCSFFGRKKNYVSKNSIRKII